MPFWVIVILEGKIKMKLKTLLLSLALVNTAIIGSFALVTKASFEKNNEVIQSTIKDGKFYQQLNDTSRQAQVDFQRQVQEWKNILIRGNDKESYTKYYDGFEKREKLVQEGLKKVNDGLTNKISHIKEAERRDQFVKIKGEIETLINNHKDLGEKYRDALKAFDGEDPETGKKVDLTLRGIDRPTSQGMDKVSEDITKLTAVELGALEVKVDEKSRENISMLLLASGILFGIVTTLLMVFRSYILRVLGAEPTELNDYFKALSQGQFKSSIDVEEKYENSIAYNTKMMHFKLRNMIKTIKNLTDEISKLKDVKIGDSQENIVESLRNTKNEVRGLKETVDKFDF